MNPSGFVNVLASIVTVAGITAVVSSPNMAAIIEAAGTAFAESISAALGN